MKKHLTTLMLLPLVLFSCDDAGVAIGKLKKPAVVYKIQKDSTGVCAFIIFKQPDGSFVQLEEGNASGIKDYTSIFHVGDTIKSYTNKKIQTNTKEKTPTKQVDKDTVLNTNSDSVLTTKNDSI